MLGRAGSVGAALVLALSPLHLWYSREARMYAPATLLIALAALALVGFAQTDRQRDRRGWAALSAGALLVGTIVVAIVTSAYSPGFAPRTLLPFVLGWSLLIGAALAFRSPRPLMVGAHVGLIVVLLCSLGTLRAMSIGAEKQQYRQAAEAGAVAATFGQPVIAIGYMAAFFDAYAPDLSYLERPALDRLGEAPAPPAFWLAYGEDPWEDLPAVRGRLARLGFERLTHNKFGDPIYWISSRGVVRRSVPRAPTLRRSLATHAPGCCRRPVSASMVVVYSRG